MGTAPPSIRRQPAPRRPRLHPITEVRKIIGQTRYLHHFSQIPGVRTRPEDGPDTPPLIRHRPYTWRYALRLAVRDALYEWECRWRREPS